MATPAIGIVHADRHLVDENVDCGLGLGHDGVPEFPGGEPEPVVEPM